MFKSTGRSGVRRAGGGGVKASSRIGGLTAMKAGQTEVGRRRRPAFLPDTPEEQTMDSNSSRVSEVGEKRGGWTGSNLGA